MYIHNESLWCHQNRMLNSWHNDKPTKRLSSDKSTQMKVDLIKNKRLSRSFKVEFQNASTNAAQRLESRSFDKPTLRPISKNRQQNSTTRGTEKSKWQDWSTTLKNMKALCVNQAEFYMEANPTHRSQTPRTTFQALISANQLRKTIGETSVRKLQSENYFWCRGLTKMETITRNKAIASHLAVNDYC